MTEEKGFDTGGPVSWRSFLREPAAYVDAEHLRSCFDGAVSKAGCVRLLSSERLRERLSALILHNFELPDPPSESAEGIDETDRRIALADRENLSELALRAGAIYWGNVLAGTIVGQEAAALRSVLGAELSAFAAANRDLAGPMQPVEPLDTLQERIEADGWRSLAAWCNGIHPAVRARFCLKVPPTSPVCEVPADQFIETGPEIARRAAQ